jgi:hypothetical protein
MSHTIGGSGGLLEKLAHEYGPDSDVEEFIKQWQLAPGKMIVSMVVEDKGRRRYWMIEDNPVKGRSIGYGREVRFGREFEDLEKLYIGAGTVETQPGLGLIVGHKTVCFYIMNRRDIFAARVVLC